jgi:glycine/D-amino acid oxidase-like deaminating enzyme
LHVAVLGAGVIGTGRLLADRVSGRKPEIDLDGLTLARYERR